MPRNTAQRLDALLSLLRADAAPEIGRLDPAGWAALLDDAEAHGVHPLVAEALLRDETQDIAEETRARLRQVRERNTMFALFLAEELKRTLSVLHEAGVSAAPFKGPSLAEACYEPPSLRAMGDLDILVPHDQIAAARDALLGPGGYTLEKPLTPDEERRLLTSPYKYNYTRFMAPGKRLVLELHWDVVPRAFHLSPDWARLWRESRPAEFRGAPMRAFAPEDELFLYALHGARHRWGQLKWLVDIDRFLRAQPGLDESRALANARECGGGRCLLLAVRLAHELLGAPLGVAFGAAADSAVERLAAQSIAWLRRGPDSSKARADFRRRLAFQLTLRERTADKLGYLIDYARARLAR